MLIRQGPSIAQLYGGVWTENGIEAESRHFPDQPGPPMRLFSVCSVPKEYDNSKFDVLRISNVKQQHEQEHEKGILIRQRTETLDEITCVDANGPVLEPLKNKISNHQNQNKTVVYQQLLNEQRWQPAHNKRNQTKRRQFKFALVPKQHHHFC